MLPMDFNEEGFPDEERLYDIIDIHGALCKFDEEPFVEKYPIAETGHRADELRELIDKRRAAIERECQEAVNNPAGKQQYSWFVAQRRVRDCFAGSFAGDRVLLKFEEDRVPNQPYNIFDIHDAVEFWEKALLLGMENATIYNDRYNETNWLKNGNEQRLREEVQRELNKAKFATENMVKEYVYSRDEAKQRVKDCYPNFFKHFPTADEHISLLLPLKYDQNGVLNQSYNIFNIKKAVQHLKQTKCLQKYPDDEGPENDELKKSVEEHSSGVKEEYRKAKSGLRRYSPDKAEQKVRGCFVNALKEEAVLFHANGKVRIQAFDQTYDIFDIQKVLLHFEEKERGQSFYDPEVSSELRESVKANRDAVTKEYQQAKARLQGYSWNEAELRVRDCFAGALLDDTDIFPSKEKESSVPKTQQTYDIFDIKNAVEHFDIKPRFDKHSGSKKLDEKPDEERAQIEEEYAEAIKKVELEHGSGFIIHDHLIITNKHVIEDVRENAVVDKRKELYVSNSVIGNKLPCEVIHCDPGKDLALLYCPGLNLKQNRIFPLQLSTQPLLPGMPIFAFGFPMSHTGETALFVTGHVSGSKETFSGHTLAVLNCSLNSGNSGGPILCWDKGQLRVVGVAMQKHFKEILTLDERERIEKIRESLQTSTISSVSDDVIKRATFQRERCVPFHPPADPCQTPMFLLTLKLYDALETHSQFNLSNALPGYYVVEFIKECISKYSGEGKEEFTKVVK